MSEKASGRAQAVRPERRKGQGKARGAKGRWAVHRLRSTGIRQVALPSVHRVAEGQDAEIPDFEAHGQRSRVGTTGGVQGLKYNSKGMTCSEFVQLMRERGMTYDSEKGRFITKRGCYAANTTPNGYRLIMLQRNKVQYRFCEHRCVWTWFNGEIPSGMEINHIDADRGNNHIENLECVDHVQNMRHAIAIGNMDRVIGEGSWNAKYSNEEVLAMRSLHEHGWNYEEISKAFKGKYPNSISRLVRGIRYGNLKGKMSFDDAMNIVIWRLEGVSS